MASIVNRPGGKRWVQFLWQRKRRTVRLGKVRESIARKFADNVELLIEHTRVGLEPPAEIKLWLQRMPDGPHQTLATAGLVEARSTTNDAEDVRTLGVLIEAYQGMLESQVARKETKPATLRNAKRTIENLREFWGSDRPLVEITPADAERLRSWLSEKGHHKSGGLAPTTVSRRCRRVREIFQLAIDERWIEENPFRRMRRWKETNRSRDVYIPPKVITAAIAATMDLEDRLLLAMARWGGVRVPSEIKNLRLSDFSVEAGTVRVKSPKTEHHDGHDQRYFPLWEPIREAFDAVWSAAPEGAEYAFPRLRELTGAAITKRAKALIARSEGPDWPKFWVNLRASCERDLLEEHPIDKVAAWMGHSPKTALLHYGRVDQQRSASVASPTASPPTASGSKGEAHRRSSQSRTRV